MQFAEALKNENNGELKTAVISYHKGLLEIKQTSFQSEFKTKITEKIKLLHSAIEDENNYHFIRLPSQTVELVS